MFVLKLIYGISINHIDQRFKGNRSSIKNGAVYAWGNHGACNCGNLLQVITPLNRQEIMSYVQTGIGEWTELAEDYCGITDSPVELMLSKFREIGLTPTDIHSLEYLDNRDILERLPGGFRWLKKNERDHVIIYFETFADMLEEKLLAKELMNSSFQLAYV